MPSDSSPPAVVAVVVTCDPGPWFEEALESLAVQDYPNLSVLVVDAGSRNDPTARVAGVLPHAYVRRIERRVGFAAAANEVLSAVEGASHLLFCHDDVALAPDAARLLVEEAFRSNAGIASPKYVFWNEPDRLLAVGATTDKVGVVQDLVDPGERDQEQHDAVREILVAPGGVTLVRADLFGVLDGFDPGMAQFGEDVDMSWRARVAGARVIVVPAARVRHFQAMNTGDRPGWAKSHSRRRAELEREANRMRTLVKCYRWFDLVWILPLAFAWLSGEALTRLFQGRAGEAWQTLAAPAAALGRPGELWRSRRRVQRHRPTGDAVLRRLQVRGNARLRTFVRSRVEDVRSGMPRAGRLGRTDYEAYEDDAVAEPQPEEAPARPGQRFNWLLVAAVLLVLLLGTRTLIGHELPSVGGIPNTSAGWSSLWSAWWSQWQQGGLGASSQSSPALALLGLLDTALFGAAGTLQHVVVLGPLLIGPWGAYRAARWWGSRRAQVVAFLAYAIVPLPYNAVARGHWDGLIAFAAAPWVIGIVGRLSGEVPYPEAGVSRAMYRVAGLGLLVALVGSVAPSFLYVVAWTGLALLAGSALAGRAGPGLRMLAVSVGGAVVAFILLFPWSGSLFIGGTGVAGLNPGPAGRLGLGRILRFDTGPFGGGWLGWALLVAAALPLLIGREWRLAWAARLWLVALASFALAWAGGRGWVPHLPPDVVLSVAAAGLAGSAAVGVAAYEIDLPGYAFGWRQLAPAVAAVALALASGPLLAASGGGQWDIPSSDAASVLAFLPDHHAGDYRVLWVGAPDALPLASRQLHPGVGYATSYDGIPSLSDAWLTGSPGAAPQLASDIRLVENRMTTKVGHLLAIAGVRYIVVPNHNGPSGSGAEAVPTPNPVLAGLGLQTDLHLLDVGDPDYDVFVNAAWMPVAAALPPGAEATAGGGPAALRQVQQLDLTGAAPLAGTAVPVAPGSTVYLGSTRSHGWHLSIAGRTVAPAAGFGWGMAFPVPVTAGASGGPALARLGYQSPFWPRFAQIVEVLLWAAAVAGVIRGFRTRRRAASAAEVADPAWFVPATPDRSTETRRTRRSAERSTDEVAGEEVWSDV